MLRNHLVVALRRLRRERGYALINVFGLALGMAAALLLGLFVRHELSYDRYHPEADRVVRVTRAWYGDDGATTLHLARVAAPVGPLLERELPEVDEAARIWGGDALLSNGEDHVTVDEFYYVEPSFPDLFSVPFLHGEAATALTEPFTLVLTASAARRVFGETDAVGRVLRVDGEYDFTVSGVVADPPANTHFRYDVLGSFATLEAEFPPSTWTNWGWNNYATYLLLDEGANVAAVEAKLPALLDAHLDPDVRSGTALLLQRLPDIHLHSHLDAELEPNGDVRYVVLLSAVAVLLLLIACFNFINLATARAARRAQEVGVRKAIGAHRSQLAAQFLGEAFLLTLVALGAAVLLAELALPWFNDFTGQSLRLLGGDPVFLAVSLTAMLGLVGLAAGGYPALFLSRFQPAATLKGALPAGRSRLRTGLVVAQFAIAIGLLIGMGGVYGQLDYVQTKRLGFDDSRLVVLPTTSEMRGDYDRLRDRLRAHPLVQSVTASQRVPSDPLLDTIDGTAEVGGRMEPFEDLPSIPVGFDFIETYGMTMAAGRTFDHTRASDSTEAFVLNETAVRQLGWNTPEEAVGQAFALQGTNSGFARRGRVIGVVEDFHFESLHERIAPMIFYVRPEFHWQVTVKLAGTDLPEALAFLETQWAPYLADHPFEAEFVDEGFGALYEAEQRLGQVFAAFAGLAILIACLGLFGLASFVAEQRRKEIGVRKVLGASVASVMVLLSKDFARLVLVAFAVAAPLAAFGLHRWLDGFAYHGDLSVGLFLGAGGVTLAVALLAVSYQALHAATIDPVKALHHE
jgi:putative ABC transport system permease protein